MRVPCTDHSHMVQSSAHPILSIVPMHMQQGIRISCIENGMCGWILTVWNCQTSRIRICYGKKLCSQYNVETELTETMREYRFFIAIAYSNMCTVNSNSNSNDVYTLYYDTLASAIYIYNTFYVWGDSWKIRVSNKMFFFACVCHSFITYLWLKCNN